MERSCKKAIIEYLKKLEESRKGISTKDLLKELGEDFEEDINKIDLKKFENYYKKMREIEWKRYMTQVF